TAAATPIRPLSRTMSFLSWQRQLFAGGRPAVAIVVAHPDDEVIGAGAQLCRWPQARVLCVTNGAPRNGVDARRAGFLTVPDYAAARREESTRALSLAGISADQFRALNHPDQQASLRLAELSR